MPPSVAAHCTPARRCQVRPNRPPTSLRRVPHQNVYAEEATASAAAWGPLASLPRAAPSTQRDLSPVRKAMNSANIGAGIAGRCQLLTWPVGALYIVINDKLSVAVDGTAGEIIAPRAIRPALEALPPHTTHLEQRASHATVPCHWRIQILSLIDMHTTELPGTTLRRLRYTRRTHGQGRRTR